MPDAESKWWHVSNEQVDALVALMAAERHVDNDTALMEVAGSVTPTPSFSSAVRPPRPQRSSSDCTPSPALEPSVRRVPLIHRSTSLPLSQRPPIAPGTPLISHRSPRPLSRPGSSSGRSSTSSKGSSEISVYVYNSNSADRIHLRVQPGTRIGPCRPGDSAKSIGSAEPSCVATTLKDKLAAAMGVDASHLRLMFRGAPVSSENATLLSYGVTNGATMQLRVHQGLPSTRRGDVVLACAAKKKAIEAEQEKDDALSLRSYSFSSPAARKRLDDRCARNGVSLMPKWVSQEHPKLFAPVGAGMDGHGGVRTYTDFALQRPWLPPAECPRLGKVREAMARVECSRGSAMGGA